MLYHQRDFRSHSPQEVIQKLYGNAFFKIREQGNGKWETNTKMGNGTGIESGERGFFESENL